MVASLCRPRIRTGYTLEARNAPIRARLCAFDVLCTTVIRPSALEGSRRAASATNKSTCAWSKRLLPERRIGLLIVWWVVSALDQRFDDARRRVKQLGKLVRQIA